MRGTADCKRGQGAASGKTCLVPRANRRFSALRAGVHESIQSNNWSLGVMSKVLPYVLCLVFALLAVWHVYMAFAPRAGANGAVPSVDGKPLFVPTRRATFAVGLALLPFAALVLATAGIVSPGVPQIALLWLCYLLALGLFGRAVGEFRYVGFFKRIHGTKFARLDTLVYSPLCLLLAVGVTLVAFKHGH